ncbi:Na+/H+ antiporter subunit E [Spirochaeta africana]|uniref:Multisubunit Na+/H+ antiporter, MnhE subunit n=1 Tax=Spirochaeta africana (strain ATCC 700263 / DSM 8902 / Z-7692) TaxID=889378 RepID=H9ULG0_SPIAZ|nr:Na+/H+ antiporter subunit E [Spirochaeta africana]AFG38353.1 multisubunit Na+/H+ antiporter, MnhE subunit [Spirochaeta africana DSM 8902]
MRYILIGAVLFGVWLLFVHTLTITSIALGVLLCSISVYLFRSAIGGSWTAETPHPRSTRQWLQRLGGLLLFLPIFFWKLLASGMGIALLALTPSISFWPGIVKTRSELPSLTAATAFANLITLTPGTLTLDYIRETDTYFIHWIDVSEYHSQTVDEQVTGGMRPYLKRIFT